MNAYQQAQTLGITGTDEEIAAKVSTLTRRDIKIDDAANFFREQGLLAQGMSGPYGALVDVHAATEDVELKAALDEIHATVLGRQAPAIRTATMPTVSQRISVALGKLSSIPNSSAIATGFYALGGGLAYAGTTAEQIALQRAAAETAASKSTAVAVVRRALELAEAEAARNDSTPDTIIAAAVAALEE